MRNSSVRLPHEMRNEVVTERGMKKKRAEKLVPNKPACTLLRVPGKIRDSRVSLKVVECNDAKTWITLFVDISSGQSTVPCSCKKGYFIDLSATM